VQKTNSDDTPPVTVEQAGKKGGDTTYAKYGSKHYREIGKKGGSARSEHSPQDNNS
jgi:hypothetical protein